MDGDQEDHTSSAPVRGGNQLWIQGVPATAGWLQKAIEMSRKGAVMIRSFRMLVSVVSFIGLIAVWLGTATPAAAHTGTLGAAGGAADSCEGRPQFGILITGKTVAIRHQPSPNGRVLGALRQFAEVNACDTTRGSSYVKCGKRSSLWYRVAGRPGFVPVACTRLLFRLANP